jgi:hypothetical protein
MTTIKDHKQGDLFDFWHFLSPEETACRHSMAGIVQKFNPDLPVSETVSVFDDGFVVSNPGIWRSCFPKDV